MASRRELVSLATALSADTRAQAEQPPLEAEQPPHRALAWANAQHVKLTEELRDLKAAWAKRNIQAGQTRIAISTTEIKHVETRRRELHLALEQTQAEIGRLNKLIRERKAQRQAMGNGKRNDKTDHESKKNCPLKSHPQWDCYFRLAAENSLAPALLKQIEAEAKGLLAHALETGVDA